MQGTLRALRPEAACTITPPMSGIRTNAAAVMLGVSPNTLRSWERRYGFPRPQRSAGNHRQYALAEIEALRQTLAETHNVSSAISLACERGEGPASPSRLAGAFTNFDEAAANRMLEESLALRSLERTVEEILLAGVEMVAESAPGGAEYEFGWRHATGWMSAMKRLSPPSHRAEAILVLDGSTPCDLDALHAQAFELVLRRSGLRSLTLTPGIDVDRLGRALRALTPAAVVLTGRRTSLDDIGRLVYAVRRGVPNITVFDFRGAVPDTGASTVRRLGEQPVAARDAVLSWLDHAAATPAVIERPLTAVYAGQPAG
jgi:MerR family transcriptional regulator, light-induced transcriptional regulator